MKRRAPRDLSLRPAKFEFNPKKAYTTEQLAEIGAITLKWNQIEAHIDFIGSHILHDDQTEKDRSHNCAREAATWGHLTICSKSHGKWKAERNQGRFTNTHLRIGFTSRQFPFSKTPFKTDFKGNWDLERQAFSGCSPLPCDFEQIVR
ncbi:MAG TPA: hypothetical protein VKG63_16335 [Steroidobacteraceae bacterium]|nr:hypothetical protein [Steroidobacteraceae bacterium]